MAVSKKDEIKDVQPICSVEKNRGYEMVTKKNGAVNGIT